MSGELQAMVDYERHDPAEDDRQRHHPKKPPPATRGAVILHGLGRLALILVALGGGVTLIAWIVADRSDKPLSVVLPTAFYFAAAAVGVFAVLGGTSGGLEHSGVGRPRVRPSPAGGGDEHVGCPRVPGDHHVCARAPAGLHALASARLQPLLPPLGLVEPA